jgi:formate--tetrahydrofolate ligase
VENVTQNYGLPAVVAINRFPTDTEAELKFIREECKKLGVKVALSEVWAKGGAGGTELAQEVLQLVEQGQNNFKFVYDLDQGLKEKINTIATKIYGADGVDYVGSSLQDIENIEKMGYGNIPVCMAKTQYSLSDDAKKLGRPQGFRISIRSVRISAGAGFAVALTGDIMTLPGLPKVPAAENIDVDNSGKISGLF